MPENNGIKYHQSDTYSIPNQLVVVAHPDDEVLWGYKYLQNKPKVICISCAENPIRRQEFIQVMNQCNIKNWEIWNEPDSLFAGKLSHKTQTELLKECDTYNEIITHNWYGEYGHPQHMALSYFLSNTIDNKKLKTFRGNWYPKALSEKKSLLENYQSQNLITELLKPLQSFYY